MQVTLLRPLNRGQKRRLSDFRSFCSNPTCARHSRPRIHRNKKYYFFSFVKYSKAIIYIKNAFFSLFTMKLNLFWVSINHIQWVKSPKIFTNRNGQAGGVTPPQSGQPDRFFPVFFDAFPNRCYCSPSHSITSKINFI